MSEKHNGWTNYETWCAKLWMDNEEGSQTEFAEMAQECFEAVKPDEIGEGWTRKERAALALSERLKMEFEEAAEGWMPSQVGFFADMLNAALSEVNWHEIALSLLDEVEEEKETV